MKKILFLTVNNLTTNPRLLKELQLAEKKYSCTVYAFQLNNWSDQFDKQYQHDSKQTLFNYINAGRKPFLWWLVSTLVEKLSRKFYPLCKHSLKLNAYGHSKRSFLLWRKLKQDKENYDLIVAHNLAALYPAYKFAKKNNIPYAFDIEDYHPGEKIDDDKENEIKRRKYLLTKMLPDTIYTSFASPLIGEKTIQLLSSDASIKQLYIPNSFSNTEFENPDSSPHTGKLKLVWFSQYIDEGRGLEKIFPVLDLLENVVTLTLIGNLRERFYENEIKMRNYIQCKLPMLQKELHADLCNYDVGLAVEDVEADFNRSICLTNKIWAYFQSGLYILAVNTPAQTEFLKQFSEFGICVSTEKDSMYKELLSLLDQRERIDHDRSNRFVKARQYSWEYESINLMDVWEKILIRS